MIRDLLTIKKTKEQKAVDKLRKCKEQVKEKKANLKKKQEELEDYKKWRLQEETNLYDSIFNKRLKQKKLDEVKYEVAKLREKDIKLLEAVNTAENELQQSEENLVVAKDNYKRASKEVEKFKELVSSLDQEEMQASNKLEELETEEFYTGLGK